MWRAALEELRAVMTAGNFETHFGSTRVIGQDGSVLRVRVADVFQKLWLEKQRTAPVTIFGTKPHANDVLSSR